MKPNAQKGYCHYCVRGYDDVNYRDVKLLHRFTSSYGKILPRRKTHVCAWHQRKLARAIKRARYMALLPYVKR